MPRGREKNHKKRGQPTKKVKTEQALQHEPQKISEEDDSSDSHSSSESSSSHSWSSEIIEPAIKTMAFRTKRGTRMKDLMKGKQKKDRFWEQYQEYFGGDLNKPEASNDSEDYQASSSGRDQFDSDFDLTDSYVGKRGRKKGTKLRGRGRGRGRGVRVEEEKGRTRGRPRGRGRGQIISAKQAEQNGNRTEKSTKEKNEIQDDEEKVEKVEKEEVKQEVKASSVRELQLEINFADLIPHEESARKSPSKKSEHKYSGEAIYDEEGKKGAILGMDFCDLKSP